MYGSQITESVIVFNIQSDYIIIVGLFSLQ